jgi:hypothetical protein
LAFAQRFEFAIAELLFTRTATLLLAFILALALAFRTFTLVVVLPSEPHAEKIAAAATVPIVNNALNFICFLLSSQVDTAVV